MKRVVVANVASGHDIVCRVGFHFDVVANIKQARIKLAEMVSKYTEENDQLAIRENLLSEFNNWLEENRLERPNWAKFPNHRICCALEDRHVVEMSREEARETCSMARDYRHQCQ